MKDVIISSKYDGKLRKLFKSKCLKCNKFFYKPKHKLQKYCSQKCSVIKKQIQLNCSNCDEIIFRNPAKLANSVHKKYFCNRRCKELAQSIGGNCKEIQPSHYKDGERVYKNKAFTKFNLECNSCKELKKYLLFVHHIDGNKKNNKTNNLEIVCANCHVKRHLKYKKNNWVFDSKYLTPRELLNKV